MIWECIPSSMKVFACLRSSPANRTTEVVPSPTSLSWDLAMSTRVLAAGCTMSRRLIRVAPSLEMVTPFPSWISLSMPLGPSVVLTTSTIDWQALMFEMICPFPEVSSVPSLRMTICGVYMHTKKRPLISLVQIINNKKANIMKV